MRAFCHLTERCTQKGIGRHAARAYHAPRVRLPHRLLKPRHKRAHDCCAERSCQIVFVDLLAFLLRIMRQIDDRRLEARERKVKRRILDMRIRQFISFGVALLCELVDFRPARITYAQNTRDLVKCLARRVVPRAAEDFKIRIIAHHHDLTVSARCNQRQERRLEFGIRQIGRCDMPADVMHRDKRLVHGISQRLTKVRPHQQRTDQTRRTGRRDRIHRVLVHFCIRQRLLGHAHDRFHVAARRDLRHHAAVKRVRFDLRVHHAGKDSPSVLDDGRRRFIAGGLNRQYSHYFTQIQKYRYNAFSKHRQFSAPAGLP